MNKPLDITTLHIGRLQQPAAWLQDLQAGDVGALLAAAADLVLVLDAQGTVVDASLSSPEYAALGCDRWVGEPWLSNVTVESRPKLEALLAGPAAEGPPVAWRQLNHPTPSGTDLPVNWRVVPLGADGRRVAFGRDLRGEIGTQQRLVGAQLSMERDYWRLRHAQTRYRVLFQQASEPVLVLDAASGRLEEANAAAQALLGEGLSRSGWSLPDALEPADAQAARDLFSRVRGAGQADPVPVRLAASGRICLLSATLFRQEDTSHFLVRLPPRPEAGEPAAGGLPWRELVQQAPDAFVATDAQGRVQGANQAFLDLAQAASLEAARGESLDRWLGRGGVDLNVLVSNVRQHGAVRLFATQLRGEFGSVSEVEVSCVSVRGAEPPCLAFLLRDVGRRLSPAGEARALPRSADQMTELVGRVPLKDIVRDTTDLIEQLCIEAALRLTGNNRASAAEMLGLSRQSLYVKLRRFGLADGGTDDDAA